MVGKKESFQVNVHLGLVSIEGESWRTINIDLSLPFFVPGGPFSVFDEKNFCT